MRSRSSEAGRWRPPLTESRCETQAMADAAGIAAIGAVGAAIGAAVSAAGSVRAARATSAAQRAREQEISAQKWEDYKRGVYRRVLDAADGLSSIDAGDPKGQERFEGF